MMFIKASLISTLAAIASTSVATTATAPTTNTTAVDTTAANTTATNATNLPSPYTFVSLAIRADKIDVHLQPVNANGSFFYLSRDSSSYCPENVTGLDCGHYKGNGTVFAYNAEKQVLDLSTSLPGGQQVFVSPDGSLSYTTAHSGFIPPGSRTTPFQYEASTGDMASKLHFEDEDFLACPPADGGKGLQIYAAAFKQNIDGKCIGLAFSLINATGTSYQY